MKKEAFEISTGDVVDANLSKQRHILSAISAGISVVLNLVDYSNRMEGVLTWQMALEREKESRVKLYKLMVNLLNAKCSDGSFKIKDVNKRNRLQNEVDNCWELTKQYFTDFRCAIIMFETNLQLLFWTKCFTSVCLSASFSSLSGATDMYAIEELAHIEYFSQSLGYILGGVVDEIANPEEIMSKWFVKNSNENTNEYLRIIKSIRSAYSQCKEDDKDEPTDDKSDFRGKGSTPIHDPSGYVYEAVLSNRLEGVTTTCYQQENGEAVVWNAEDYSQKNPLKTDDAGFYRWDVPQGMWQVKYEKEGYETTYSEWLPVPPPQLDVNVGMKQSTPPTVTQMRGFESGITIDLSKYMLPATLNETNITVTRNDFDEKGRIELMNEEKEPKGEQTFASKVKFVPESLFNTSDLVVVTVHKEVESYCGVKMLKDHVETVKIESEIKSLVADSAITVPYQSEKELRIVVLPKEASAGRTLLVRSSSPMIASISSSEVTIDPNGTATLTLGGELPGGAIIDFSVEGTDVTATSKVEVTLEHDLVATPTASIRSGETIESGTVLTLSCTTEGAVIYYTLDGSCPCDEATRYRYDGPITIASDVIVKAIAVKEGMDDSDVATFVYLVNGINSVLADNNIRIDSKDQTIIVTGAEGASCQIYDLQGRIATGRNHLTNQSRFKMKSAGIYLLHITLPNGKTASGSVLVK